MKDFFGSRWRGFLLALCGLVMIAAGIYRGEVDVVLKKAANICLECIGIG